jgi:hypothetical protein
MVVSPKFTPGACLASADRRADRLQQFGVLRATVERRSTLLRLSDCRADSVGRAVDTPGIGRKLLRAAAEVAMPVHTPIACSPRV